MSAFDVRYGLIHVDEVRGRLIRNANYGGASVSLNGWRWRPSISNHTKPGFQDALEKSIREDGVRNPILVWNLPEGIFLTFGGSRLRACRSVGIKWIPAIINDYCQEFEEYSRVTPKNWKSFFTDPPRDFEFGEYGADYHYNLERARRHDHDPAGFNWVQGDDPEWMMAEFPWVYEDD